MNLKHFEKTMAKARQSADVRMVMPQDIMARWKPEIHAADTAPDESTINIYDMVGEDFWTGAGMTAKIVSGVLRKNKGKPVTVNINSPGGDFFEGVAIYNLLKEHDSDVTVRVVGMAASAASVIAMAGNTIKIAESGFIMIHNAWHVCVGNKNDMRERADVLEAFDASMQGVYAKKTGMDEKEIAAMMDAETWIGGKDAVEKGFATQLLDSDEVYIVPDEKARYNSSLKEVDSVLAKAGLPRSKRRELLKDLTGGTPGAALVEDEPTPRAGENENHALAAAVASLRATVKQINEGHHE